MMKFSPIGEALRKHRAKHQLSLSDLAHQLDLVPSQLLHYEGGSHAPTVRLLRRIAVVLGWGPKKIGELVLECEFTEEPRRRRIQLAA